jgi:hypothetical protein
MEKGQDYSQYPLFDVATKLTADVLFVRWDGLDYVYSGGKPDITKRKFTNFLKRMGLPDTAGQDLIDTKRACFENKKISVPVRKISEIEKQIKGKELSEKQYHEVEIMGMCEMMASPEERRETIHNISASCPCLSYKKQIVPHVNLPSDKHIFMGMNYSSLHMNTYNLEIFGYPNDVVQAEKELIVKMKDLRVNKNWPLYRINRTFREFGDRIFNPLIKMVEM